MKVKYKVITDEGIRNKEYVCSNVNEFKEYIRDQNYKIKSYRVKNNIKLFTLIKKEINEKQVIKDFYFLIRAKLTILESLEILETNYSDYKIAAKIKKMKNQILRGKDLTEAFSVLTKDEFCLKLINIAEQTGNLENILKNIVEKMEFDDKIKKEIKNIMIYPLFILGVTVIIVMFLLKYIIPNFKDVYKDLGQEIPTQTKLLFYMSDVFDKYTFVIIILIILFIIFSVFLYNNKKLQVHLNNLKSKLFKKLTILKYIQYMDILLKSHINILEASRISKDIGSIDFKNSMERSIMKLKKGKSFSESLKDNEYINEEFLLYLNIGEKTGDVSKSFHLLRELYNDRIETKMTRMIKLIEPVSIILVGGIIGFIIFSIMIPILKIGENIGV